MKEVVIISGKGGTGKTSISASFAYIGGEDVIVADCDVDAADMHLLLKPDYSQVEDFYSGRFAKINYNLCTNCGQCIDVCRFDAISEIDGQHTIDEISCEGCSYCSRICPTQAITLYPAKVGNCYISQIKTKTSMIHARLGIGADNSGKLVTKVKDEAKRIAKEQNKEIIIIDGSPGVGCPVVASLTGANFVVLVTEPSMSGIHDLKRVYELVKKFRIKAGCIINKADINKKLTTEIIEYLKKEDIINICSLPYNENFTKAMTVGKTIVEYDDDKLTSTLTDAWQQIIQSIN